MTDLPAALPCLAIVTLGAAAIGVGYALIIIRRIR